MENINVLILVASPSESTRITNLFRENNFPVRAHRVTSKEDFIEHVEKGEWHLLITDDHHMNVPLSYCLSVLKDKGGDMPVLLLAEGLSLDEKVTMTEQGVTVLIDKQEDRLFLPVAKRAARCHANALQKNALQADYNALLARTKNLLEDTDEAIAYVAEGILIECNQLFAEKLGFSKKDDLVCLSLIDLIEDKNTFKRFFKQYSKDNVQDEHVFQFIRADQSLIELSITLKTTTHQSEDCVQVTMTDVQEELITEGATTSFTVLEQLEHHHGALMQSDNLEKYCFVLISINDFDDLQRRLWFSGTQALRKDLQQLICKHANVQAVHFINDATLAFFYAEPPTKTKSLFEDFCHEHEHYIFECKKTSLSYKLTCQIANLYSEKIDSYLDQALAQLMNAAPSDENSVEVVMLEKKTSRQVKPKVTKSAVLSHETIAILYQPIMSLRGEKKETYEVTYAIQKGFDGDSLAKDSTLDQWVIIEATKALATHRANGHDTRLLINLSRYALIDTAFSSWIKVVLKASNLPVDAIIFQFDEEDIVNNLKQGAATCNALRANDHLLAVTSFSEQASSLQLLKHIHPHFVHFKNSLTPLLSDDGIFDAIKVLLEKLEASNVSTILSNVRGTAEMASLWQIGASYMTGSYLQEPDSKMAYEFAELH